MSGWIILTVLVLIAIAAPRYGADSRDASTAPRHSASLRSDIAQLWHALTRWAHSGVGPAA